MVETLGRLLTDLGEKSVYDAASQCSRCGYCEQACPTYVATGREAQSPRGRNQIVRLMLEGKLDDPAAAEEALATCLLCGACQTACYAKVPVADIVLEGRRALRAKTHWLVKRASRMLVESPRLLGFLLKAGYGLKRSGLSRPARPFLRLMGLDVLAAMDEHVQEAPWRLLDELLPVPGKGGDRWLYFAPCGPRYLFPRVGAATWKALSELEGPGCFLGNSCCGLLAHNYGDLEDARTLARKNIEDAEAAGKAPIVGDCSSCVAFLKSYPQLFLSPSEGEWRSRAAHFAARVKDVVQVYGAAASIIPGRVQDGTVTCHDSCRALNGQGIQEAPREAARAVAGESFREMPGADVCCGGAGAFAFAHEELSDDVLRRKVGNAASVQARTIVTSSTSCLIQLARGLRKYYPDARVLHLSEVVAGALAKPHGT